jgi:hypothetical protein
MFVKDKKINDLLNENSSFNIITENIRKIHNVYREEGHRIYEINELNKLPFFDEEKQIAVEEVFNILLSLILEKKGSMDVEYKNKYLKYKKKYLLLKLKKIIL